ncbi:alpha/beta fold hydrolase [Marinoscillum sp.]|uniref:alpha/beta hydrolase family protein n=1 Tax=Marinoscillum sp. TaxID=2024838 RepID=UPI003BAC7183
MKNFDELYQLIEKGYLIDLFGTPKYLAILSHGAGAGMDHPFMNRMAELLSKQSAAVIRFNFSYLKEGRKFPSSSKQSIGDIDEVYHQVRGLFPDQPIILGGKSYGGRMSSHWLAQQEYQNQIAGLFYLGFPLHAPGKPGTKRADHLTSISIPQLFLQGTNDKLAQLDLIEGVIDQQKNATLKTIEHADHSFKAAKKYGKSEMQIMEELALTIDRWALDQL